MKQKTTEFLYPNLCLHCQKITENHFLVCDECRPFFELTESNERCPHCFCESERACKECREKKRWTVRVCATFERRGPIATLHSKLQDRSMPYLFKTAASFMAVQFSRQGWPRPDVLIPFPRHFLTKSVSQHLADHPCPLLQSPVQRRNIEDKFVLLITDVLDREKIDVCAERLFAFYPRKVNVLSLTH